MQKTLSFFWSGGENTSPCFQRHCFLCLLDPWDCGIGTKMIFLGWDIDEFEEMYVAHR